MEKKYLGLFAVVVAFSSLAMVGLAAEMTNTPQGWTTMPMNNTAMAGVGSMQFEFKGDLYIKESFDLPTDIPSFTSWRWAPDHGSCHVYLDNSPVVSAIRQYDAVLVDVDGTEIDRVFIGCPTVRGELRNYDHSDDSRKDHYLVRFDVPQLDSVTETTILDNMRVQFVEAGTNTIRAISSPFSFGIKVTDETVPEPPLPTGNSYSSYECYRQCRYTPYEVQADNCMDYYPTNSRVDIYAYFLDYLIDRGHCDWV